MLKNITFKCYSLELKNLVQIFWRYFLTSLMNVWVINEEGCGKRKPGKQGPSLFWPWQPYFSTVHTLIPWLHGVWGLPATYLQTTYTCISQELAQHRWQAQQVRHCTPKTSILMSHSRIQPPTVGAESPLWPDPARTILPLVFYKSWENSSAAHSV